MSTTKTVLNRFFLLFLILLASGQMNAMHIIGGEITYEFVNQVSPTVNRYKFKLRVYRDCNGGGARFDSVASVSIYRGDLNGGAFTTEVKVPIGMIESIRPDTPDCVSNFPNVCAESALYEFTRDLPVINQSYVVVYQRCCRNLTIRNLINPGDVGASYYTEITPLAQQIKNSSPVFKAFPRTVICNGIPLFEDQSATDKDGHQLVYSFCSPVDGGGTILAGQGLFSCDGAQPIPSCGPPFDQVPFVVPTYTPGAPMGGSPVIQINSGTGLITGTPNSLGQFVVGVCVQEFFNGQLVGTLQREFQFNLADCTPELYANVTADTALGPKIYVVNSCGPLTVFVKNESTKKSNIDSVRWIIPLPGGQFGQSTDFDLTYTFPDTGSYTVKLLLNPGQQCSDSALVYVNIFPDLEADFGYAYDTCIAGPVTFTDLSKSGPGIVSWNWEFGGPTESSKDQSPEFLYKTPGLKDVALTVVDTNGCRETVVNPILWQPAPPYIVIAPDDFLGCTPATITFTNLSSPIDSTYSIIWDFGDNTRDTGVISPVHVYDTTGVFTVKVFIVSPIGCAVADTFPNLIRVAPSPTAAFDCDPSSGLNQFNNTVQFTDKSLDAARWGWKFGLVETSIEQNPMHTFRDTGLTQVILTVTHAEGCRDSVSKWLDFSPVVTWTMPNAFTPNGDSFNESYAGNGLIEYATNFKMSIWNRWGELVYETTNPRESWNGTVRNQGTPAPDGVYVYLVEYNGPRGEPTALKGFVNLIR
jgi:gliding motility-associated-like protein